MAEKQDGEKRATAVGIKAPENIEIIRSANGMAVTMKYTCTASQTVAVRCVLAGRVALACDKSRRSSTAAER